jgi:hypothetical protein
MSHSQLSNHEQEEEFVVGRPRPKNNPLIHRSEVGKPSFHNDMPKLPDDYVFGAANKRDAESAGEVMLTWQVHCPPPSKMQYDFGRDFLTLNKKSVQSHCTSAKDVAEYRKSHDARLKPNVTGKKPAIVPDRVAADPNYSYGSKSGESESVADLIQNRWEMEWVQDQRRIQAEREKKESQEKARRMSPARQLAKYKSRTPIPQESQSPALKDFFTLKQFRDVPSRYKTPTPTLPDIHSKE